MPIDYGSWEISNNASYYPSKYITVFPTSNSEDEGKVTIEENMRSIVTRITKKNYKLTKESFKLEVVKDGKNLYVTVGPGEANIIGYHIQAKSSINIRQSPSINDIAIGMSLAKDGSDHVTGDIYDGASNTYSGCYIKYYNLDDLIKNLDKILILGMIKVETDENGDITDIIITDNDLSDNRTDAEDVQVDITGLHPNPFDSYLDNYFPNPLPKQVPGEPDYKLHTKPPTYTSDLQEYLNNMKYWYVSKYGDNMTGALTMSYHRYEDNESVNRSIIISPRRPININKDTPEPDDNQFGGTIRTMTPSSYEIAKNNDLTSIFGTYAELVSSTNTNTGLIINSSDGDDNVGYTFIGHEVGSVEDFKIINDSYRNRGSSMYISNRGRISILSNNPEISWIQLNSNIDKTNEDVNNRESTNSNFIFYGNRLDISNAINLHHNYHSIGVKTIDQERGYDGSVIYPYYEMESLYIDSYNGQNHIEATDPEFTYIDIRPNIHTEKLLAEIEVQIGPDSNTLDYEKDIDDLDNSNNYPENGNNYNPNETNIVAHYGEIGEGKNKSIHTNLIQKKDGIKYNQMSDVYGIFSYNSIGASDSAINPLDSFEKDVNDDPYKNNSRYVRISKNLIQFNSIEDKEDNTGKGKSISRIIFSSDGNAPEIDANNVGPAENKPGVEITHRYGTSYLAICGSIGVTGTINSPHIATDKIRAEHIEGGTSNFGLVYNAVYNDIAENYRKDKSCDFEPGDIISKKRGTDEYTLSTIDENNIVVGVYSDTYGYLLGGEKLENMEDNNENYIPVGLAGRVKVKVLGQVDEGDYIAISSIPGVGIATKNKHFDNIVGRALQSKTDPEVSRVEMQIMLL